MLSEKKTRPLAWVSMGTQCRIGSHQVQVLSKASFIVFIVVLSAIIFPYAASAFKPFYLTWQKTFMSYGVLRFLYPLEWFYEKTKHCQLGTNLMTGHVKVFQFKNLICLIWNIFCKRSGKILFSRCFVQNMISIVFPFACKKVSYQKKYLCWNSYKPTFCNYICWIFINMQTVVLFLFFKFLWHLW